MTSQTSTSAFRQRFILLLLVIIVAGMSQGLLLPLLSILLEQAGVPPEQNGMNSAAMYIGIFGTMLFIEKPVRRFGYKPVILAGIALITTACLLFPATSSLSVWFLLRLLVGVGDSALHYSTQLWIVSSSPAERRGRYISLYGMSYGLGFSLGPLGINLLTFGDHVPFYVSSAFYLSVMLLMLRVRNERPPAYKREAGERNRFRAAYRLAWFALIPSFLYGLMEASMNSSFPLYGMRIQLEEHVISLLLLSFGIGGLLLQLPLGIWSDRIGRKPILIGCGIVGASAFLAVPLAGDHVLTLIVLFMMAGGVVGSFYSLGLAYAADIMPVPILPVVNVIASIHFSIGSMTGPTLGGYGIQYVSEHSIFLFLGGAFLLFGLLGFLFRPKKLPF
ncbi:MFS transporter [Paenibacillus sp. J5C_2022]|nr:MFS transporter [Paenibacillus sp. J5C2022]MCU6707250.1 MFS transporter [Paenibacillus sp. J5C2022]